MKILKVIICFLFIIKSSFALDLVYDNLDLASKNLDQNYGKLSESKKAKIGGIIEEMEELSQELVELSTYKEPVNLAKVTVQKRDYIIQFKSSSDFLNQFQSQVTLPSTNADKVAVNFNGQLKSIASKTPDPMYTQVSVVCKVALVLMAEISPKQIFPESELTMIGWFHSQPLLGVGETMQERMEYCKSFLVLRERFPYHKLFVKYAEEIGEKFKFKKVDYSSWYDSNTICQEANALLF